MTRPLSSLFRKLFVVAILFSFPAGALADVITVPAGLNPGDHYRLVFVSSAKRDATSTNIADYNDFISNLAQSVPELAALGTTWSAIGSTATVDARDNTGTNPNVSAGVAMYRLDGGLVAYDNNDLWDGTPTGAINITELGNASPLQAVWTGTDTDGTAAFPLGSGAPSMGAPLVEPMAPYLWIRDFLPAGNEEPAFVYGMSGVLTVVPEPGTIVMGGLGLCALVGCHVARRKRNGRA